MDQWLLGLENDYCSTEKEGSEENKQITFFNPSIPYRGRRVRH
ncbi:hypothetical protein AAZX31_11G082000 [Glycine max]